MNPGTRLMVAAALVAALAGCESSSDDTGNGIGSGDTTSVADSAAGPDGSAVDAAGGTDSGAVAGDGTTGNDAGGVADTGGTQDAGGVADTGGAQDAGGIADTGGTPDTGTSADTGGHADVTTAVDTSAPTFEMDEEGCITYAGASALCGAASEGDVCALAATCRPDGDESQCHIDCEMSPSVGCLDQEAIDCVLNATAAGKCEDLGGCAGWYLVY